MAIDTSTSLIIRSTHSVKEAHYIWQHLVTGLGWNRDPNDAQIHFELANQGKNWLVIVPKATGQPKGCIVPFIYRNGTGWVGFFIMDATYRGNGWGAALFRAALDTFAANNLHFVGLDGVEEQVQTYARRGFVEVGRIKLMTRASLKEAPLSQSRYDIADNEKLVDIREVPPHLLSEYDHAHTGFYRPDLWTSEALFSRPDLYGYAILSNTSLPSVLGIVMARHCDDGRRFGPLYADSYTQASTLLHHAMQKTEDEDGTMVAEIFGSNPAGMRVFQQLGWNYADVDYHRMWLGGRVPGEQQPGGRGTKGMFALFDAAAG